MVLLLLSVLEPALLHVGFANDCASWEGHGPRDHYGRNQGLLVLPAASILLLLARRRVVVLTCILWRSAWCSGAAWP